VQCRPPKRARIRKQPSQTLRIKAWPRPLRRADSLRKPNSLPQPDTCHSAAGVQLVGGAGEAGAGAPETRLLRPNAAP
jgi:hypothetical protein